MDELRCILGHSRWNVLAVSTVSEANAALRRELPLVIVSQADLPDGSWKDVLAGARKLPIPPPVVVTAPQTDDYLWMEVLNGGGYNVLSAPFREREVFRILSMAWLRERSAVYPHARASA